MTRWEFNYRGNLVFLEQANAAQARQPLRVVDGWIYFIHGWQRCLISIFRPPALRSNC